MNMDRKKILVIDDDRVNNLICKTVINRQFPEAEICFAENGQDGLGMLLQWEIFNQTMPNLVLLDINMPIMDGWEFLDRFNERFGESDFRPNIVMLSSTIDPNDEKRARQNPWIKEFISKPFTTVKLINLDIS